MSTMLKMSEAASLALHTMGVLAQNRDVRVTTREIASKFKVSEAHLSKVLQRLAHEGLVSAVRGPKGGFAIAKDPDKVTMLDVYEVIEGPVAADTCVLGHSVCGREKCIFGGLIETINTLARKRLAETVLSDLAATNGGNGSGPDAG